MTKIAILTGASSGIGRAIDERLLSEGWRAVRLNHHITGKQPDEYKIDLNDLTATAQLGKQLASELEHIDAFIHVAGIWHDAHEVLAGKKLADFMPTQIAESMNVGVTSAMVLCNALLPRIQSGTVIGISGTFADGAAGWLPY
jgi:NAD(P)-dependent dehydrogenase (short-subunit alcohol dehydrogenase family)